MVNPDISVVVYFQADDSIGLGHCVRVRALVDSLPFERRLVLAADGELAASYFRDAKRYPFSDILEILAEECRAALVILITDHPNVPEKILNFNHSRLIQVAIDDIGSAVLHSDILLNCSGYPGYHRYSSMQNGISLLGLKYLPLRIEFCQAARLASRGKCLGVMAGSSQIASDWVRVVLDMDLSQICSPKDVRVVMSPSTQQFAEIQQFGAAKGISVRRGLTSAEMVEFFQECRLCVMTAGMSLYEAFCCGVPVVAYPIHPDMKAECAYYEAEGLIVDVIDGMNEVALVDAVRRIWTDSESLESLSARARAQVDGQGIRRVSSVIAAVVRKCAGGEARAMAVASTRKEIEGGQL